MDGKKILVVSIALNVVFAVAAGYFYVHDSSNNEVAASLESERDDAIAQVASLKEENNSLKSRVALLSNTGANSDSNDLLKLRRSIDEKDAELTRLKAQLAERTSENNRRDWRDRRQDGNGNQRRGNPEEAMERLKADNPERYEQIMQSREKMRQEQQARVEKRDNYLNNLNLAKLTHEQQQIVSDYKDLIKKNEELRENMRNAGGDMGGFREVMRNQMEMNNMASSIRDILIEQYAGANVAEEVKNILDATSNGMGQGGFGGGPMGPGGFGGGRGGFGRR